MTTSMTRSATLSGRLIDLFLDGNWIANTNWKIELSRIDFKTATHPVQQLNTIAAITGHVNYYLEGLLQVMDGGPLEMHDSGSFSTQVHSSADWEDLSERFIGNAQRFISATAALDDAALESPFVDPKYGSWYRNIEAVVEHGYYHLGQIVLLRKLILQPAGS